MYYVYKYVPLYARDISGLMMAFEDKAQKTLDAFVHTWHILQRFVKDSLIATLKKASDPKVDALNNFRTLYPSDLHLR